jgi:hypothetical protein
MTFTNEELAACAEREVKQRRRAYPRWVEDGRMSQTFADQQIALMEWIARDYRAKAKADAGKVDLFGGAA